MPLLFISQVEDVVGASLLSSCKSDTIHEEFLHLFDGLGFDLVSAVTDCPRHV